jgi:hypothetical protein
MKRCGIFLLIFCGSEDRPETLRIREDIYEILRVISGLEN